MSPLAQLLARLDADIDGPACAGHWDLFDPRREREPDAALAARVDRARTICRTCPVLERCHDVAADMPTRQRIGVWAGNFYDDRGRPRGAAGGSQ